MSGDLALLVLVCAGASIGAVTGSFLNVVIHRIPRLLDREEPIPVAAYVSSLAYPSSHCPSCRQAIAWRDKIPVLSYIALKGRCRSCEKPIGARYLAVEVLAAIAFAYCIATFGLTGKALLGGLFISGLVTLSTIDLEEQLLPDAVVAPLFGLGLLFQMLYGSPIDAAWGAAVGFGALWLIRETYRLAAGDEGMGYGDVKLAATIGVWVGAATMPAVLFTAFAAGVIVMAPLMLSGLIGRRTAVPFGPFLACGGLLGFLLPGFGAGMFRLLAV